MSDLAMNPAHADHGHASRKLGHVLGAPILPEGPRKASRKLGHVLGAPIMPEGTRKASRKLGHVLGAPILPEDHVKKAIEWRAGIDSRK